MSHDVHTSTPNCEDAVSSTGWGLYHHFMIGIASACAIAQAAAFSSVPFAIPLAVCDISPTEDMLKIVDSSYLIGGAIGGLILTCYSDLVGRKFMISCTLIFIFSGAFASGFSHGNYMLMLCIFLLGSGLVANTNCVKIHLAEILPAEKRGFSIVIVDLFWSFGYIVSNFLGYWLTPDTTTSTIKSDLKMEMWRLMFGLASILSIMVACATALLQPSPRYLIFRKKYITALDTLKRIYAINNSKYSDTFPIRENDLWNCVDQFSLTDTPDEGPCCKRLYRECVKLKKTISLIFRKRFLLVTIVLAFLKFTVAFGILSANIWLAKMLENSGKDNCTFNGMDIIHIESSDSDCKFKIEETVYSNFFLVALSIIFGYFLLLVLIDFAGRKFCIIAGCLICGGSSFGLAYVSDVFIFKFMISSAFMACFSIIDATLNIVAIESYPTAFRGTATGCTQFFAYVTVAIVKLFLQTPCQHSFIFIGALLLAGAVLGCFLPELSNRPMIE